MNKKTEKELIDIFCSLNDPKLMKVFLKDILTPAEYEDVVKRLELVKMLDSGLPQREIAKKLGISIARVTRGSRALQTGTGGFKKILEKFYKK